MSKPETTRDVIMGKVYDREIETCSALFLSSALVHVESDVPESTVRVDDIRDGEIFVHVGGENDDYQYGAGFDLTPEQAREFAQTLYNAAEVATAYPER